MEVARAAAWVCGLLRSMKPAIAAATSTTAMPANHRSFRRGRFMGVSETMRIGESVAFSETTR
jgi:hypothetical protein